MAAFGNYVLYGGGDLAIEVATYLLDILDFQKSATSEDEPPLPLVSDIISVDVPRLDDFKTVLSHSPTLHSNIETVKGIEQKQFVICVGNPENRHRIFEDLRAKNVRFATVVHPLASVASTAKIGRGSIICPFVFVGPFADIGDNCTINVGAIVGHDAVLGTSSILSPGADVNGRAETGEAAFLGAGSVMHPKARLGAFGKLSSGSVLSTLAGDGFLMHGNPAKGRQMTKIR